MLPPNPQDFHFSSLSLKFPLLALGFQLSDKVQIFVNTKRFQGLRVNQNVSISHSAFWVLFDYYFFLFRFLLGLFFEFAEETLIRVFFFFFFLILLI